MRIKSIHLKGFKRFTDTTIRDIPETARLVVLAGPNGSGKSSIFDGLHTWHGAKGAPMSWDHTYGKKEGSPDIPDWRKHVSVEFYDADLPPQPDFRKVVYQRTAFRNQADFSVEAFKIASPLSETKIQRMIDNDVSVSDNFIRLIMQTIDDVFGDDLPEGISRGALRDRLIGEVQAAMRNVLPDLTLTGVAATSTQLSRKGTFYFAKGSAKNFLYKNLSAGEKAVFDLLLDAVLKRKYFDDSIWCIDEPEAHLNTRVQGKLLDSLLDVLPGKCQLWIASHSIGFMSRARALMAEKPGTVVFIDMFDQDFDSSVVLTPVVPKRDFWSRTLDVALGDLAELIAPAQVVLCEGRPADGKAKSEFDAQCYRTIFADSMPDTDFISVGNSQDVHDDRLHVGRAIQTLVSGTKVIRLIDRDIRNATEIEALKADGVRVLTRRHLEAYLLDDAVITALCERNGQLDKASQAIASLHNQLKANQLERGKDPDDFKAASGEFYVTLRKLLGLSQSGLTFDAFARSSLAPLVRPGMTVFDELYRDIFGS